MSSQKQIALAQAIYNSMLHTHEIYVQQPGNPCTPYEPVFRDNTVKDLNRDFGVERVGWECNVRTTIVQSGMSGDLASISRVNGMVDILIRDDSRRPEIVIELKREFNPPYDPDIKRIRDMLLIDPEQSSIQYGIMAFAQDVICQRAR
jgi:hypothetical protein